jgi:hypothetical protein
MRKGFVIFVDMRKCFVIFRKVACMVTGEVMDRLYGRLMQRKKRTLKEENRGEPKEEVEKDEKMQEKIWKS